MCTVVRWAVVLGESLLYARALSGASSDVRQDLLRTNCGPTSVCIPCQFSTLFVRRPEIVNTEAVSEHTPLRCKDLSILTLTHYGLDYCRKLSGATAIWTGACYPAAIVWCRCGVSPGLPVR